MKTLSVVFAVLLLSGVAVKADFKFDGDVYSLGWEAKTNHAIIKEFYARNETMNNWTTIITFQAHPAAVKVKEVSVRILRRENLSFWCAQSFIRKGRTISLTSCWSYSWVLRGRPLIWNLRWRDL